VQELHALRNCELRSPDLIGAIKSLEGQVAQDPQDSGLGISAFAKLKGARRNSESASCEGSHRNCVEYSTWHRHLGTRGSKIQRLGITSGDVPKY
jgi:hypothetical protein